MTKLIKVDQFADAGRRRQKGPTHPRFGAEAVAWPVARPGHGRYTPPVGAGRPKSPGPGPRRPCQAPRSKGPVLSPNQPAALKIALQGRSVAEGHVNTRLHP